MHQALTLVAPVLVHQAPVLVPVLVHQAPVLVHQALALVEWAPVPEMCSVGKTSIVCVCVCEVHKQ